MKDNKIKKTLEEIVAPWKGKKGNLIMILHDIQDLYGYIPRDVSLKLSELLDEPMARIYEVITFYNYFKLKPPGKHKISVCMGTACYLKGASEILSELKTLLNVEEGDITVDGLFQIEVVRCFGCCGLAPAVMIDGKVYGGVKKEDLLSILSEYTNLGVKK